jgi:hypothetical protein
MILATIRLARITSYLVPTKVKIIKADNNLSIFFEVWNLN